ncbi:hypothetical protein BJY04DRAFT_190311 [Aspergillus karnatakaensis]|uniref:basic secretory family protein n=1 Tax=Aspergillus karnatakaensis TaxID=1810916 RepID=UPI003CCD45F7
MVTPSAIPKRPGSLGAPDQPSADADSINANHPPKLPTPKFRLEIHDLRHPASQLFITLIPDLALTLESALTAIIQNLYTSPTVPAPAIPSTTAAKHNLTPTFKPCIPPTRSVTILLRDIGGVAYTTGTDLDNDHKEIHISLSYIQHCRTMADPLAEIVGVITHELVHCYQYAAPRATTDGRPDNTTPRAPGGLVEGVADFVRLKAGLDPPHWSRPKSAKERSEKWDSGYQHTAYFLAWLEDVRVGKGAVGLLNDRLARVGYIREGKSKDEAQTHGGHKHKDGFWKGLFGAEIDELWEEYGTWLDSSGGSQGAWEDEIVNRIDT